MSRSSETESGAINTGMDGNHDPTRCESCRAHDKNCYLSDRSDSKKLRTQYNGERDSASPTGRVVTTIVFEEPCTWYDDHSEWVRKRSQS